MDYYEARNIERERFSEWCDKNDLFGHSNYWAAWMEAAKHYNPKLIKPKGAK